jgi:hypothetical protein
MTAGAEPSRGTLEQIAPASREFLLSLFTDLREDLADQVGAREAGHPGAEEIARKGRIYDALLGGLAEGGELPEDEVVCEYVLGLARATDEANQYEQTVLEHRAFAELTRALGGQSAEPAAAVDWDRLLVSLLHPTQFQIIEAMHWIGQPISASQLVHVLDRDRHDVSALSYHLRRLGELKVAELVSVRSLRGAKERLYELIALGPGRS